MLTQKQFCNRKLGLVEGAAVLKLVVRDDLVVRYIRHYEAHAASGLPQFDRLLFSGTATI